MKSFHYLFFLFLSGLFSCAQQGSPAGGPKDTDPPKIIKSFPKNFSLNYSGNIIRLEFNEYISVKDIDNQLIISPPLKHKPEIKYKSSSIEIIIKDTLYNNTTYAFNFGNAIVDYTESNVLDSNLFVFSTGNFMDSLTVSGSVKDAFDLSAEKNVWVMLYDKTEDSALVSAQPRYLSKTREDGSFIFNHIKEGEYKLFALNDKNTNYLYDLPNEKLAFADKSIVAGDSIPVLLYLFQEEAQKQFLKKATAENYGKLLFVFNKPLQNPKISSLTLPVSELGYIQEKTTIGDTLIYWLTKEDLPDSLFIVVSDNETIIDTAEIKLITKEDALKQKSSLKKKSTPFELAFTTNVSHLFHFFDTLKFEASHPIKNIDKSKIVWHENDSIKNAEIAFYAKDLVKRNIFLKTKLAENKKYLLQFLPGAFQDIFGLTNNDTITFEFNTRSKNDYGSLLLKPTLPDIKDKVIIQLMNDKDVVIKENFISLKSDKIEYQYLLPAKYKVKLIYDSNKNNKWDTGNFGKNVQPEKVIYFSGTIEIKAGFDKEVEWTVD